MRARALTLLLACALWHNVQAETLTATSPEWPPFFMQIDGKPAGIGYEILMEVARRSGDQINIRPMPVKRALKMLHEDKVDIYVIDSALWNDPADLQDAVFSENLMSVREYIYFMREHYIAVHKPEDLAGKTVHILKDYSYAKFEAAFDNGTINKHEVYNEQSLIETLVKHRANAIFMDSIAFDYNIKKLNYSPELFKAGLQLSEAPLGIKVRLAKADILPRFNQAIAQMKADGSIDAIVKKYTQ
jgi:polar amino acid transport system substrate-binding protein